VRDGLCNNFVNNFVEAPDGAIWICTWNGVSIYDPLTGQIQPHPDLQGLNVRNVIFVDDWLCAATASGLIARHREAYYLLRWNLYYPISPGSNLVVDLLFNPADSAIWAATEMNGILKFKLAELKEVWEFKDANLQNDYETLPYRQFKTKYPDIRYGMDYFTEILIDSNLFKHDRHMQVRAALDKCLKFYGSDTPDIWFLNSLDYSENGELWAFARTGVYHLENDTFRYNSDFNRLAGKIHSFRSQNRRKLFAGWLGGYVVSEQETLKFNRSTGLPTNEVRDIFCDVQGHYWILTLNGTLHKLVTQALKIYDDDDYPFLRNIEASLKMPDGSVLFNSSGGLFRFHSDRLERYPHQPRAGETVMGIALDKNNDLVVVSDQAVYLVRGERIKILLDKLDTGSQPAVFALDRAGRLWIAGSWFAGWWNGEKLHSDTLLSAWAYFSIFALAGNDDYIFFGNWNYLFRYNPPDLIRYDAHYIQLVTAASWKVTPVTIRESETDLWLERVVTCGAFGPDSAYWFGSFSGYLNRLAGDTLSYFTPGGALMGRYYKVRRDPAGNLYFLASEGVTVVTRDSVYNLPLSLPGRPSCHDIAFDAQGRRLLATSEGLLLELDDSKITFDKNSGLADNAVQEILELAPDKYLLVQPNSLALLNLQLMQTQPDRRRPLILTSIQDTDGKLYRLGETLKLKLGRRYLKIAYALTDFTDERSNRYAWRLVGMEDKWSVFSSDQTVIFRHLPPGTYRFELKARSGLGAEIQLAQPLTIIVPAYFYETWWLWLSLLTVGFGVGLIAFQGRLRQMRWVKVRLEAQVAETQAELEAAEQTLQVLTGLIPICANCKKVRDDRGYWQQVEKYIAKRSAAQFSHGICPDCMQKLYPEYYEQVYGKRKG